MRGDVGFLAGDRGLHLGHAVEVLLVVALVAAPLGLAVVVFLLQRGQALLLASAARPRGCGARRCRARAASPGRPGRRPLPAAARTAVPGGARLGPLDHRDRRAFDACCSRARSASLAVIVFGVDRCPGSGRSRVPRCAPAPAGTREQPRRAAAGNRTGAISCRRSPARSTRAERPRRQAEPDCHAAAAVAVRPPTAAATRRGRHAPSLLPSATVPKAHSE